ncbi:MAG: MFS transporter [Acidimicrobiales bacterium]
MAKGQMESGRRRLLQLWAGFAMASSGDGLAYGAVPLLALAVDPHPLGVSLVVAADGLPWLLMALPAGALADRFERGRVMALANLGRAAVMALVVALLASGSMNIIWLIAAVLANGAGRATYFAALQAGLPDLVGIDGLGKANGVLSSTEATTEHLGGPIAGTLAFALARSLPFIAEGAAFVLSTIPFVGLRPGRQSKGAPRGSILDGVRCLARDRRLRLLLALVAGLAGLQGLVAGVLVIVATRDWGVHLSAYGLFVASGAVGNLPGALIAERVAARLGSALSLLLAAFAAGCCYVVMALSDGWLLAGAAFALAGFGVGVGIVVSNTLRQRLAPPELIGRVGAAWRGIIWGAAPVGAIGAGALALLGGLRLPLFLAGGLQCALVVAIGPALLRAVGKSFGRRASVGVKA